MSTAATHHVKVTDAGPSLKKLAFEIPASAVDKKLKDALDSVSNNAAMPGFRAGKVPKWLVEKRFGTALKRDAKNELASEAYRAAIQEHKISPVSDPSGGNLDKVELIEGKPFHFELEVEVLPEFELPDLENVAIKKPTIVDIFCAAVEKQKIPLNPIRSEPKNEFAHGLA